MEAALQGSFGRTPLGPAVLTIGNALNNQLVVNDPKVSSHHAQIRPGVQGYSITDLGSTNGTFVNGQRLDRNIPRLLSGGDRIHLGDTMFTYEVSNSSQVVPTIYAPNRSGGESFVKGKLPEFTGYGQGMQQDYQPPAAYSSYVPPLPTPVPFTPLSQQANTLPWTAGGVPNYSPPVFQHPSTPPPVQQKSGNQLKVLLVVLAVVLVLGTGGGGIAAYLLTRPQPVISVTSDYRVGSIPAGSTGTVFHVSGHHFSGTSAITFLLDRVLVTGSQTVQSDADGNIRADLTVTDGWAVGNHTLLAKDAAGYTTQVGPTVTIVPQGQAHTPGPNGAPPDDMSFTINATVQAQDAKTGEQTWNETVIITGQPDGGSVCESMDDGQPHTFTGDFGNGVTYTKTMVFKCSGTYKGGKLSYTETVTSIQYTLSNGETCGMNSPFVYDHLEGIFSNQNTLSGSYSADAFSIPCSGGGIVNVYRDAGTGTWTGALG